MKAVGQYNNIPKNLQPPKLKKGEVVTYRLLCGVVNPDDTRRSREPILYPQSFPLSNEQTVKDPETGEYFKIAIITGFEARNINGTTEHLIKKHKLNIPAKAGKGLFSVQEGNALAEDIYEFCELSNENKSNPHRDPLVEPLFERVDEARNSKERSRSRSQKLAALQFVQNLSEGAARKLAASLNWNDSEPIEILMDKLETYAEQNPAQFSKLAVADDVDVKAVIKRAVDSGKVSYDVAQHRLVLVSAGTTLIKLDKVEGQNLAQIWLQQAAEYCLHNKNGEKVLSTIKKLSVTE